MMLPGAVRMSSSGEFVFMGQGGIFLQYYLPDTQKRHLSSASDLLRVMAGVVMGF